jgi:hypothetical protein
MNRKQNVINMKIRQIKFGEYSVRFSTEPLSFRVLSKNVKIRKYKTEILFAVFLRV